MQTEISTSITISSAQHKLAKMTMLKELLKLKYTSLCLVTILKLFSLKKV